MTGEMEEASTPGVSPGKGAACAVELREPWLVVSFATIVRAVSWAIVGGGFAETRRVAWLQVKDGELPLAVEPRRLLAGRLRDAGLTGSVGLLTSRRVGTYSDAHATEEGVRVRCVATVGLGNALRAGDPPWSAARVSTINVLVHSSAPLSDEALLEASSLVAEAKCAAMLERPLPSGISGRPATGTGTDCTVVTCPRASRAAPALAYAGKHTAVGAAIGQATTRALAAGIERWWDERP